ncbi:hypothetical protein H310_07697 [Aphanomyces invadans]|uniref:PH domain-containing protein n=1 Tax=Aphanomyces invadans TaxID=157072 RepID=A0A024U366_9STRA|nr:hypothetical protein H310_07697 [Aphanomyces invadans]ETW00327.1 hypothetical protein H310_07697 [Aphanomyces invadans]RHY27022.1 hypothetical protein DYB32_007105 [Aphanomyces invadans]|eukprot:XP_008871352.1 hypothetical protein H310_07697 [Aphanomyces invadans]
MDGSAMLPGHGVSDTSMRKTLLSKQQLQHNGNNPSIVDTTVLPEQANCTPWTPKSLGRAKSAIVYRQTLNDNLMFLERNIFFFHEWRTRFVSLQDDHILIYATREKWEQGTAPDRIVKLNPMMLLSAIRVDVQDESYDADGNGPVVTRLFRRKLLETDPLDQWLNGELRQGLVVDGRGSNTDTTVANNPEASARAIFEFATTNQHTFELWSKCLRRALQRQVRQRQHESVTSNNNQASSSSSRSKKANVTALHPSPSSSWVSPGQDSRVTLLQSEIWCTRLLQDDKEKAESELRRIIAMERLVAQVTGPAMALLVYEKVSRVHELFAANSRREMNTKNAPLSQFQSTSTGDDATAPAAPPVALSPDVLHFFGDHLKRKYAVFLMLALAHGISEDSIRDAHERMCRENDAVDAGVGGGDGIVDDLRDMSHLGFRDAASIDLYNKYRTAAANYFKMNFGDPSAAEEEDAIMHLPVMLHVAIVRQDEDEVRAMAHILDTVKERLLNHVEQGNNDVDEGRNRE